MKKALQKECSVTVSYADEYQTMELNSLVSDNIRIFDGSLEKVVLMDMCV